MLRVADQWHQSDLGRQRHGNEDSFYARAPLFAVADGMGGAQAGEVASAMAVEAFEHKMPGDAPAEDLVTTIKEANRRIHERSRTDQHRAGMGTTLTAAYVGEGDEVFVAHVGDSRCYLLRDGDLIRLTRDHSLVEELLQRGKLTQAQAESHPQRSVITRALGPEPNVEVDLDVFPAKPGDVYLLCSDGLTSMVSEARLKEILTGTETLEAAGRALIANANEAGGRDNITVILFRLEAVEQSAGAEPQAIDAQETKPLEQVGGAAETRAQQEPADARGGATTVAVAPAVEQREGEPGPVPRRTTPLPESVAPAPAEAAPAPPRRRRRRTVVKALVIAIMITLPIAIGAWLASRAVYFIGTDSDGRTIAIFRGLPYELPLGIDLYERHYRSGVTLTAVPASRRASFTDHKLRSIDDAEDIVRDLERGRLNP